MDLLYLFLMIVKLMMCLKIGCCQYGGTILGVAAVYCTEEREGIRRRCALYCGVGFGQRTLVCRRFRNSKICRNLSRIKGVRPTFLPSTFRPIDMYPVCRFRYGSVKWSYDAETTGSNDKFARFSFIDDTAFGVNTTGIIADLMIYVCIHKCISVLC